MPPGCSFAEERTPVPRLLRPESCGVAVASPCGVGVPDPKPGREAGQFFGIDRKRGRGGTAVPRSVFVGEGFQNQRAAGSEHLRKLG